jgi:NAD-dependent SIR2 family protein deacetylase
MDSKLQQAAETILRAEALVITSGAGMGVDSGLPDFRGDNGFWQAYPMYQHLDINFYAAANPSHFADDPAFGWGFYGHRTNLYRQTEPHIGFDILQQWAQRLNFDTFVVTSNVDGQFQKAGFDPLKMLEVHGSIHHLQCQYPCSHDIWPNDEQIPVDMHSMRAQHLPKCRNCQGGARPNILMFSDFSWVNDRASAQEQRFHKFLLSNSDKRLVIIEIGAGSAVPTIRNLTEQLGHKRHACAMRINPREPQIGGNNISLPLGALEALIAIDHKLENIH